MPEYIKTMLNGLKVVINQKLSKSEAFKTFIKKSDKIPWDNIKDAPNVGTLVVNFSYSDGVWHCDKTYDEIIKAYPNVIGVGKFSYDTCTPCLISFADKTGASFVDANIQPAGADELAYVQTMYTVNPAGSVDRTQYIFKFDARFEH